MLNIVISLLLSSIDSNAEFTISLLLSSEDNIVISLLLSSVESNAEYCNITVAIFSR